MLHMSPLIQMISIVHMIEIVSMIHESGSPYLR
jgi:hypothetical protein